MQCVQLKLHCSIGAVEICWPLWCVVPQDSTSEDVQVLIILTLQNLFLTVSSLHSCSSLFIYLLFWPQTFWFHFKQNGNSTDEHRHCSQKLIQQDHIPLFVSLSTLTSVVTTYTQWMRSFIGQLVLHMFKYLFISLLKANVPWFPTPKMTSFYWQCCFPSQN